MGFFRTEGVGFRDVGFKCVGCKVWVRGVGGGGAVGSKDQGGSQGTCSHHNLVFKVYSVMPWRLAHKKHFWIDCKKKKVHTLLRIE